MLYAKHIYVLHLLSTVPRAPGTITPEQAVECWDFLFDYIHTNWSRPTRVNSGEADLLRKEARACREMLIMNANEIQAKLETLPPYFAEFLFPVAVGRYLLRELRLPVDHRKLRTYMEFCNRYGRMILADWLE